MRSSMTSLGDLKFALYIFVEKRLAPGASCNGNVSSIHANTVILFRSYTCLKRILINDTFSRLQVKGQRRRLNGWPWHLHGRNSVNLGIIKMKRLKCKQWSKLCCYCNHDDVVKWKHFRVTGPLSGGSSEFPSHMPVSQSFDVFFDLRLNKRLSKQRRRRWFETL